MEDDGLSTSSLLSHHITTGAGSRNSPATTALVLSTAVALCGSLTVGLAAGYSSPAESGIREDLGLSLASYSLFSSLLTMGAMIGAALSGKISDLIGRRATMGLSQILAIFGWLAVAFSKDIWWLDFGRFSLGVGEGFLSYAVPVYITEITPKNLRGSFAVAVQLLTCCGVSVMFLIGTVINWRALALIAATPGLVQILGLFFIPESPRWLAKVGREKELEASLQSLRGKIADISEESVVIREYTEAFDLSGSRITDLFQRRYAHSLTVGIGLMLLQQFGGSNGISSYASSIFELADFSSNVGTMAMGIVQIPSVLVCVLLMDRIGRRPLLLVSITAMCLGAFLVGLSFLLQGLNLLKDLTPVFVFIGILVYSIGFTGGMAGIPWVVMSEIFPINIKGSAVSLVAAVSWLSALVIVYSFNFLTEWSSAGTFFIFSLVNGLGIVFIEKLVLETKGRTIEEIQASITHLPLPD